MPATDGEREFTELIRSKLADEAKDYQQILDALPADWFEQVAQGYRRGDEC